MCARARVWKKKPYDSVLKKKKSNQIRYKSFYGLLPILKAAVGVLRRLFSVSGSRASLRSRVLTELKPPHLWIRVLGKDVEERRLATLRVAHHHDLAAQESFALHRLPGVSLTCSARLLLLLLPACHLTPDGLSHKQLPPKCIILTG